MDQTILSMVTEEMFGDDKGFDFISDLTDFKLAVLQKYRSGLQGTDIQSKFGYIEKWVENNLGCLEVNRQILFGLLATRLKYQLIFSSDQEFLKEMGSVHRNELFSDININTNSTDGKDGPVSAGLSTVMVYTGLNVGVACLSVGSLYDISGISSVISIGLEQAAVSKDQHDGSLEDSHGLC